MSGRTVAWVAFGAYLVITTLLAIQGMRKTKGMESFLDLFLWDFTHLRFLHAF